MLRLTPYFNWPAVGAATASALYPAVGGQQEQVLRQTLELDSRGLRQVVVSLPMPDGPSSWTVGKGVELRGARGWAPAPPGRSPGAIGQQVAWILGLARLAPSFLERVDLIHVHSSCAMWPLLGGLQVQWRLHVPLVVTVHCSTLVTYRTVSRRDQALHAVARRVERRGIATAAQTMVLTECLRTRLVAEGLAADDAISVVPDSIDIEAFQALATPLAVSRFAARHRLRQDRPIVAYVGRISGEKGWRSLVQLADKLRGQVRVLVCGGGEDEPLMRREVIERGLQEEVTLAGFVPRADVPAALGCASVVVLPSRFEELGSVALEAMAMSRPVVAFDAGGISEAVIDGRTGLLAPAGDAAALAVAVRRVVEDAAFARRLGENGLARARERHQLRRCCGAILDVYRRAVGEVATS